jgi:hypothetical protein
MATMPEKKTETLRYALARMLRSCADYLDGLPSEDAEALIDGDVELRLALSRRKGSRGRKASIKLGSVQVAETAARLQSLNSRSEGERVLGEVAPTKAALQQLARYLDVTTRKDDRAEDLVRRIIEATIGYRLSSAAIQGRPLNRNRENTTLPMDQKMAEKKTVAESAVER